MIEEAQQAFEAWKSADAQARGAETRVAHAWDGYFAGKGEPPSRELVGEASSLRAAADQRLAAAMQALGMGTERPSA